jgi:hypothetical protein
MGLYRSVLTDLLAQKEGHIILISPMNAISMAQFLDYELLLGFGPVANVGVTLQTCLNFCVCILLRVNVVYCGQVLSTAKGQPFDVIQGIAVNLGSSLYFDA